MLSLMNDSDISNNFLCIKIPAWEARREKKKITVFDK